MRKSRCGKDGDALSTTLEFTRRRHAFPAIAGRCISSALIPVA
jgi:hypothetical protein